MVYALSDAVYAFSERAQTITDTVTTLPAGRTDFAARVMGLSGLDNGSMETRTDVSEEVLGSSPEDDDLPAVVNTRTQRLDAATDRGNTFPASLEEPREALSTFAATVYDLRPTVTGLPATVTDRASTLSTT